VLANIVVHPDIEAADNVFSLNLCGDHNDRRVRHSPDFPAKLPAGEIRKREVKGVKSKPRAIISRRKTTQVYAIQEIKRSKEELLPAPPGKITETGC
jgi:hypothetical protein